VNILIAACCSVNISLTLYLQYQDSRILAKLPFQYYAKRLAGNRKCDLVLADPEGHNRYIAEILTKDRRCSCIVV